MTASVRQEVVRGRGPSRDQPVAVLCAGPGNCAAEVVRPILIF